MDDNDINQFTLAALHMAGHTDEQIEAMRAKAVEEAKPKPVVIIPWRPIPQVDWEAYYAEENAKKAALKVKRDHQDRLDREKDATEEALEEVEHTKKLLRSSQDQIEGLMKAQGRH
jgi:hypothetical protein